MWESEKARSEAILRMVNSLPNMKGVWGEEGPTDAALEYLAHPGRLSSGEQVMLTAAFDLWNGTGRCTLDDLLCTLDGPRLRAVADALLARDRGR